MTWEQRIFMAMVLGPLTGATAFVAWDLWPQWKWILGG